MSGQAMADEVNSHDRPGLRGPRVLLRALGEADLPVLQALISERAVVRWWGAHDEDLRAGALDEAGLLQHAQRLADRRPADPDQLRELNLGLAGASQVGKFITVYPTMSDRRLRELAQELHAATEGLAGPGVLSDRRYRSRKPATEPGPVAQGARA